MGDRETGVMDNAGGGHEAVRLRRALGLTFAVLYGLGITIGAGIFVLVGEIAARAGPQAPFAFLLAALVMAPSGASFAELASRFPKAAGEATYVREGFRSDRLALLVGLMVIAIGTISAATVGRGSAGYIRELVDLPLDVIVVLIVLAMGAIAAWGIVESVAVAGAMTLISVGALVIIVALGAATVPELGTRLPEAASGLADAAAWSGILGAALIAFFAFTGFEALANIAEEVKRPRWTIPRAILVTLAVTTLLYMAVVWVVLNVLSPAELGGEAAPLSRAFERLTGASPAAFSFIAVLATVNGIVFFIVLASRVIYGLAAYGLLPERLGRVHPVTRTPLLGTALVIAAALVLALALPIEALAEMTSRLTLVVFAFVNGALIAVKRRGTPPPHGAYVAPGWVPAAGLVASLALLASEILRGGAA